MHKHTKADFCIRIDFEKGSESPSRVFRAMSELIETFQAIDVALIHSISTKIEPIAIIEDIETGSLKAFLSTLLKAVDDDALKKLDWKTAVGKYLVKSKYFIIDFMEGKSKISSKNEIEQLEQRIFDCAVETDVKSIPAYTPVKRMKLLQNIERIASATSILDKSDCAVFITLENEIKINASFDVLPEDIEELMTKETLSSSSEVILKVKRPDYLGESRWEFRLGTSKMDVKILDSEWLIDFHSRKFDIRPGDSLRGELKTELKFGYDQELIWKNHFFTKIIEILPLNNNTQLSLDT